MPRLRQAGLARLPLTVPCTVGPRHLVLQLVSRRRVIHLRRIQPKPARRKFFAANNANFRKGFAAKMHFATNLQLFFAKIIEVNFGREMEIADPLLFSAGSAGARPVAACAVAGRSAGDSATRPRQSTSTLRNVAPTPGG